MGDALLTNMTTIEMLIAGTPVITRTNNGGRIYTSTTKWVPATRFGSFDAVMAARDALVNMVKDGVNVHSTCYRIRRADGSYWRNSYLVSLGGIETLSNDHATYPLI